MKTVKNACLVALIPGLLLSGCEKKGGAEVEQACRSANANLRCDLDDFGEDHDEAIKECMEDAEDAGEISEACSDSHLKLLSCLGDLACTNIGTWRVDKCGEVTEDYCGPEAAVFCEQCPGIWYAEDE